MAFLNRNRATFNEYDRRITIKVKSNQKDILGAVLNTYSDLFTNIPAAHNDLTTRERLNAGVDRATRVKVFQIRFSNQIEEKHFVEYEGDLYRIIGLEEVGRKKALNITCERET